MEIHHQFDPATSTFTYVVFDPETRDAVVIDPVLDYDPLASQTSTESVDKLTEFIKGKELKVHYSLETHAHADHLSGGQLLKERLGAKVAIGDQIKVVQKTFKPIFGLPESFRTDGAQFDELLEAGKTFQAGSLSIQVLATPGHTPACVSYVIGDAVFTGDALFIEDFGTGRCDFPAGSAEDLYTSVHETLYALPDETRVFVGHDYGPGGREIRHETTIGTEKAKNKHIRADSSVEEFVKFRTSRDAELNEPKLLFQSVQVNIDAGRLPAANDGGLRHLRTPLNLKRPTDDSGQPV